jgi:hypothetical protein
VYSEFTMSFWAGTTAYASVASASAMSCSVSVRSIFTQRTRSSSRAERSAMSFSAW